MARYGSDQVAFFLIDGYDVLGVSTELQDDKEALIEDTTALGDSWGTQEATGVKKGTLTQKGFYDDAADSVNDALSGQTGVDRVVCYGVEGNTTGKHFTGFAGAMATKYKRIATKEKLTKADADYVSSGAIEEGVILHPHATETAAGDTTSSPVDNGASSANGGSAYLEVSSLTLGGYTDLTVTVQHSADNVTYADLTSFTAVTSAPEAERKVVTGTVDEYLAAAWSFSGAGSNPSAKFMVGFARN